MSLPFAHRLFIVIVVFVVGPATHAQTNPTPFLYPLTPSATEPGGPAFTLTVNGTGFVSGAVVNWNRSARTTTFVNSSQVTAAITPADIASAGTAMVTVTNPGPGGGTSNAEYFQVTNALTATNFTVFANNEIDGFRNRTSDTLAGDFNGDGKLDLVAYANGLIYFLPGNGDGTFGNWVASVGPPPSTNPSDLNTYLATADLNGDGILDLVLMNNHGTFIALGNGNGTFGLLSTSLSDVIAHGFVVIADFNGDGFLDLAYTTRTTSIIAPGTIQVQLGKGDGTFLTGPATVLQSTDALEFSVGAHAAGDFNADGKLDLLVSVGSRNCAGTVYFFQEYPGNGDGSFRSPLTVPSSFACLAQGLPNVVVGDFNGDGKLDVANFVRGGFFGTNGYVTVDLGNGDGTFQVPYQPLPQPNNVSGPLLEGDFNGDGKIGLSVGNQLWNGNGDGTFTAAGPTSSSLQIIQAGDFNGDGRADLLALGTNPSNSSQTDLRLLTQVPAPPDFSGGMTPTRTVVPGNSVKYAGSVTALNGFTGNVTLSASGMPTGVIASFNPGTVTDGSGTYAMTVSVTSSVAVGTYSITVTGTSGSLLHSSAVTLIVNSSPGDFSSTLAGSDSYQNIVAGQTATYKIEVTPIDGFKGDVNLSMRGAGMNGGGPLPGTATFNPSVIVGGSGTSVLTITTTNPVPFQDVYTLTITATSGPLMHTGKVYLGISNNPGDFTGTITPTEQTIKVGQAARYTANIAYLNGFTPWPQNPPPDGIFVVELSVVGLPPGAQYDLIFLGAGNLSPGQTNIFTISAPVGTPRGTYNLLLIGNAGDRIRTGAFSLTIE